MNSTEKFEKYLRETSPEEVCQWLAKAFLNEDHHCDYWDIGNDERGLASVWSVVSKLSDDGQRRYGDAARVGLDILFKKHDPIHWRGLEREKIVDSYLPLSDMLFTLEGFPGKNPELTQRTISSLWDRILPYENALYPPLVRNEMLLALTPQILISPKGAVLPNYSEFAEFIADSQYSVSSLYAMTALDKSKSDKFYQKAKEVLEKQGRWTDSLDEDYKFFLEEQRNDSQ